MWLKLINNHLVCILYYQVSSSPVASAMPTTGDLYLYYLLLLAVLERSLRQMLFPDAHVQCRLQQQITNTHYLKQAKYDILNNSCMEAQRGSNARLSSKHLIQDRHIQVTPVFLDSGSYWCCSLELTGIETKGISDGKRKCLHAVPRGRY